MDEIKVISGDKDGADLRREKARSRYYTSCDGKADDAEINEAISSLDRQSYFISAKDWERIFEGKG